MTQAANRHKYNSQALFVSLNSVGSMYQDGVNSDPTGERRNLPIYHPSGNMIEQLHRVQSLNYGFSIDRMPINQYGELAKITSVIMEPPTVNLSFNYFLADAYNEMLLGLMIDGETQALALQLGSSGCYDVGESKNYHVLLGPSADDLNYSDLSTQRGEDEYAVVSIGNGYITEYRVNGAVGSIPSASVSIEGLNIKSDTGYTGILHPGIDECGAPNCDFSFSIPNPKSDITYGVFDYDDCCEKTVTGVHCLLPGDICINLSGSSLISKSTHITGDICNPYSGCDAQGASHIQAFQISAGLERTSLNKIGNHFAYYKSVNVPSQVSLSVDAFVADLKDGHLWETLCAGFFGDVQIVMYPPSCGGLKCPRTIPPPNIVYTLKNVSLENESFDLSIGDNKTVRLDFKTDIGGKDDPENGFFISGRIADMELILGQEQLAQCDAIIQQPPGICAPILLEKQRGKC